VTSIGDGVVPVIKPPGMTSHDVVAYARRLWRGTRVGHTGTLDPQASGLLLLCVGQATRLAEYLQGEDKVYVAELILGVATDTGDSYGNVTAQVPPSQAWPGEDAVRRALEHFTGVQEQVPPMASAVRVGGKHLYEWARVGRDVERPVRTVEIYRLEYLGRNPKPLGRFADWPAAFVRVECQAGTYVRSLCADIGAYLGTGGHMGFLHRERAGSWRAQEAWTLEELQDLTATGRMDAALVPMAKALRDWPLVTVTAGVAARLRHGQAPRPDEVDLTAVPEGLVGLTYEGSLCAVARYGRQQIRLVKVFTGTDKR